jgi:glycosyltransferase involved in cell wall biosynthesis
MEINPASGIFVARLTKALAGRYHMTIITPDAHSGDAIQTGDARVVKTFRYAPKTWQRIAHTPGGIPVALKKNKILWLILPVLLISMFMVCLLSARKAALIHANWSINGFVSGLVGKILRKPVITTLRGEDVTRAEKNILDMLILKSCLALNDSIVCVNKAYKSWLDQEIPAHSKKLVTIENGIDDSFIEIGKHRNYSAPNTLRILTVGSLIPRKSLDHAIKALANPMTPTSH